MPQTLRIISSPGFSLFNRAFATVEGKVLWQDSVEGTSDKDPSFICFGCQFRTTYIIDFDIVFSERPSQDELKHQLPVVWVQQMMDFAGDEISAPQFGPPPDVSRQTCRIFSSLQRQTHVLVQRHKSRMPSFG